ncbi:Right handed beta helix region [Prosthecobacter debontii]|uniref:Right handed beta helix region n=1 Tax=Prosthecobacter debontii TaxID=48467 RepID=A0A1T4Z0X7_9BACT|nr:NosD domain-containing protein [Prosthecobacter debontii]SKB07185.1 Right handed beta helix region [Prosthecobacter debontii]
MNTSFLSVAKSPWIILLVLIIGTSTLCQGQTSISKFPCTITKPGNYALVKSITYAPKAGQSLVAITINCDDVKIDFRGNKLSIDRQLSVASETVGIFALDRKNIAIRNGTIENYCRGIFLEGTNGANHIVENMEITDSTFLGIQVKGKGAKIKDNFVNVVGRANGYTNYTALRYGIFVASTGALVSNNRVLDVTSNTSVNTNSVHGLYLENSESAIVTDNHIMNTTASFLNFNASGIRMANCDTCVVETNHVAAYAAGFYFSGCDWTVYRDNAVVRTINSYYNPDNSADDGGGNH